METRDALLTFLQQPGFLYGVLFGVALSLLTALLIALLRRPPQRFEAFTTEQGKVLISRHALQEQIQRRCEELAEVGKARATIVTKSGLLAIRIQLRIRSNAKLTGISGFLQEQIEIALRRNLGIENIGPIDIVVIGILPFTNHEQVSSLAPDDKSAS